MMFASKTSRDLNRDDQPYVSTYGFDMGKRYRVADPSSALRRRFEPRPEFDHPQHNDPNGILIAFRMIDAGRGEYTKWLRDFDERPEFWTRGHLDQRARYRQYTPAEVAHARRVLTRLASLQQHKSKEQR